jgi:hypothetical protein
MRPRSKYAIKDLVADFEVESIPRMPVRVEEESVRSDREWRCILRPLSLGLIGLAVAVFLWGLAYKLSLYHSQQNNGARTNVAKMSVSPRPNLVVSKRERPSEHPTSNPQLVLILTSQAFRRTHTTAYAAAIPPIDSKFRHLLTALRSPPPQSIEVNL